MAQLGNERRIYIVTGTDPEEFTFAWLSGEQTNSFNVTAEAIDTSDKSNVWSQFVAGKRGATIEATLFVDDSNAQQKAALQALHTGAEIRVYVGMKEGTGADVEYHGRWCDAIVTSVSDTNDNGSVSTRNISLTVNGQPQWIEPED